MPQHDSDADLMGWMERIKSQNTEIESLKREVDELKEQNGKMRERVACNCRGINNKLRCDNQETFLLSMWKALSGQGDVNGLCDPIMAVERIKTKDKTIKTLEARLSNRDDYLLAHQRAVKVKDKALDTLIGLYRVEYRRANDGRNPDLVFNAAEIAHNDARGK